MHGERKDLRTWEKACFKVRFERASGWVFDGGDRGSVFQAEGPKTEKKREPTVECLDRGILRRRAEGAWRWVKADSVAVIRRPFSPLPTPNISPGVCSHPRYLPGDNQAWSGAVKATKENWRERNAANPSVQNFPRLLPVSQLAGERCTKVSQYYLVDWLINWLL